MEEFLDHRQLRSLDVGQLLPAALFVHLDRFAALLGHLLEHVDHRGVDVLQKMAKQRRESIQIYEQGGRQELADIEAAELAVIEEFLHAQMSDDQLRTAIEGIKVELGASTIKDMGQVMATLKARHGSEMDMGKASGLVKASIG